MLLFPSKTKFKKYQKQKRRFKGKDFSFFFPHLGFYGLKTKKKVCKRVYSKHLAALKLYLQRKLKKKKQLKQYFCIYPDLPVTKKSSGVRMGKGKGSVDFWCSPILSGRLLFELKIFESKFLTRFNFLKVSKKLPFKTKFISRKRFHLV